MQIARTLFTLGIWVIILPFLGFPYFIKNIIFVVTGLVVIYVSLIVYKEKKGGLKKEEKSFDNFSENSHITEEEN